MPNNTKVKTTNNLHILEVHDALKDAKVKLFTDGMLKSIDDVLCCTKTEDFKEEMLKLESFVDFILNDIKTSMESKLHLFDLDENGANKATKATKAGKVGKEEKCVIVKGLLGTMRVSTKDNKIILANGNKSMWSEEEFLEKIQDAENDYVLIENLCRIQGLSDSETARIIDMVDDALSCDDDEDTGNLKLAETFTNDKKLKGIAKVDKRTSVSKLTVKDKKDAMEYLIAKQKFDKKLKKLIFTSHVDLRIKSLNPRVTLLKYLPNMYTLNVVSFGVEGGAEKTIQIKANSSIRPNIVDYMSNRAKYNQDMVNFNIAIIRRIINYICQLGYRDELVKIFSGDKETNQKYARIVEAYDIKDLLFRLKHKSISKEKSPYNYDILVANDFYLNKDSLNHYSTCKFVSMLLECFFYDLKLIANL